MIQHLQSRLNSHAPAVVSVCRIVLGLMFTLNGTVKLFGWPVGPSVAVGDWPFWWAGLIELIAGLLIVLGWFTPIAALVASGEMAVAYFWLHQPNALWPVDPQNGGEFAVLYCFAFLLLAFAGPGAWALDTMRGRSHDERDEVSAV
ncbi:DoxX family protein [Mycobacterium sp. TNTM28]|uniref:DoxX family protein n=1 Tax=[Mycobacterium] fortunisiensis TaxID=2600579 RepID=A0ABS6KQQ2_9MYCO|nr:DoxX family protein [[Mycobacterium] fortunisiensis]MBU9765788.1 DoxX family protein [[Mycobacterium] fortunisiensis]